MSKKLSYFELNGLAEAIRYILHYSGQKFEDVRFKFKEWPVKEVKDSKCIKYIRMGFFMFVKHAVLGYNLS